MLLSAGLGTLFASGCGTSNEDEIAKAGSSTATGNAPQYKSYAEFAKAQTEAQKAQADAQKPAKGAARKAK